MPPTSLTLVLPAYNEEGRLGPALDELFGYLRRRGERARYGSPGAALLPPDVRILVVTTGARTGRPTSFAIDRKRDRLMAPVPSWS